MLLKHQPYPNLMYWYSPSPTSNLSNPFIMGEQVPCPFSCKCWSHPNQRCRCAQPLLLFLYCSIVHHICWDCSVPFQCSAINTSPTLTRGTGAYPLSPCLVVRSNHAICFRKQVQYWSHILLFRGYSGRNTCISNCQQTISWFVY